ncbi:hypothetical protein CU044_2223 [Streptomyces sp. L-9-10]|uniref:hypothetical protein n=1 Tax=Streptomyces sp. L-9-10 TaxID=1478131 RepID=UPI0010DE93B5|nr:hypothetical protein [Streptomyces sp. L-9-10]RYJ29130.1 hypothetical protein CU044_2223 [Streptomyces sp. L-9-10]
MDTSTKATLAAGVAAGYVVGRTKNGKLALGLLSVVAGRSLDPLSLIGQGIRKLAESPQFGQLSEQVRGELLTSGRSALSGMTNRGVASVTDALQQRTRSLLESEADSEAEDEEPDEESYEDSAPEEPEEEEEEEEQEEEEEEEEPPRRTRRRPTRQAPAEKPTDRKPGPKNPPAKKAMEKKAADRKAAKDKAPGRSAAKKPPAGRGRRR